MGRGGTSAREISFVSLVAYGPNSDSALTMGGYSFRNQAGRFPTHIMPDSSFMKGPEKANQEDKVVGGCLRLGAGRQMEYKGAQETIVRQRKCSTIGLLHKSVNLLQNYCTLKWVKCYSRYIMSPYKIFGGWGHSGKAPDSDHLDLSPGHYLLLCPNCPD